MTHSDNPIIAIIGQPNVGKSTLINKIAGGRRAITSDVAGTTRDRQYLDTVWNGADLTFVDTAGITGNTKDELEISVSKQIEIALKEADLLMLVVDGKEPIAAVDRAIIKKLRTSGKPSILVVNKVDSIRAIPIAEADFQSLGVKPLFAISAASGRGIGDMLDHIVEATKREKAPESTEDQTTIAVSIIGKPNVGKSSLFNTIIKEERVVVSSVPGTTRTAIDTKVNIDGQSYLFIDTAGLKRKDHRQETPDVYAGFQTFKSIRRSDICLLVVDATLPITSQDQRLSQEILDLGKGVIIIANKMDAFDGNEEELRGYISFHFPSLWMSPLFLVSAKTGDGIPEVMSAIKDIFANRHQQASQEDLNTMLRKKLKVNPPKLLRDQRKPKVYGLNQLDTNPPLFELVVNIPAAISQQFRDAVKNGITKELGFWGTPIKLRFRGKDKR